MENIFKKWYFWVILVIIIILLLSLRGCKKTEITQTDIEHSIVSTIVHRGGGSIDDVTIESVVDNLVLDMYKRWGDVTIAYAKARAKLL